MADRRVLMFPWPVGAGHTGRCLVMARLLQSAGYEPLFATESAGGMVKQAGLPALAEPEPVRRTVSGKRGYLAVTGPDNAYASMGYYHASRIRAHVERDRELIRRTEPEFIVTHMQPTAVIAARCEGVAVISVADADFFVTGENSWMPWITPGTARLSPFPPSRPAFNQVLQEEGLPAVDEVSDLLVGDLALIASAPELERPSIRYLDDPRIHYVGPMLWDPDREGALAARLSGFGTGRRTKVYFSVGGGAVVSAEPASAALEAAAIADWSLLLSTGFGDRPREAPDGVNVLHQGFGGLTAAVEWADVVVCHGGHSTIVAALSAGKPVLVMPSMSENEANGRLIVEANGAGLCLYKSEPDGAGWLRVRQTLSPADPHRALNGADLVAAVARVTGVPSFRRRAQALGERLAEAAEAGDVTELLSRWKSVDPPFEAGRLS